MSFVVRSVKDFVFARPPEWVDIKLKPGNTSQSIVYGNNNDWLWNIFSPSKFVKSANLIWLCLSAVIYVAFPYEASFDRASVLDLEWICQRAAIHMTLVNGYYGFWHTTLYVWRLSKRKFNPDNQGPSKSQLFHNIWYTNLGTLQWTLWEVLFLHCYATQKIRYVSNAQLCSSWMELGNLWLWIWFVPLYRELHFYISHRFLHFGILYKYIHSLHHRNTDPEPFAGLAMHPIEHMYYMGCVAGLSLYIHASPFIMLWNGVHMLISPAASHSGWEDHYMSGQHHFIHHAKFECNYGTSRIPIDKWFGTYREKYGKISSSDSSNKGQCRDSIAEEEGDICATENHKYLDGTISMAAIFPETLDQIIFNVLSLVPLSIFQQALKRMLSSPLAYKDLFIKEDEPSSATITVMNDACVVGLVVSVGPIMLAYLLQVFWFPGKATKKKKLFRPFHKDSILTLSFHLVLATLIVIVPVFQFVISVLQTDQRTSRIVTLIAD